MISYILASFVALITLFADYFSKEYVMRTFFYGETKPFINGIMDFCYIHNKGAAWGVFSGKSVLLILITAVIMILCIIFLIKFSKNNKLLFWAIMLVMSGGIGNMYDRIFRNGKVIDFFHFQFWPDFPIFNIADCAITIGAGLLILYFIIDTVKEHNSKKDNQNAEM